jgi:hypothetical protein
MCYELIFLFVCTGVTSNSIIRLYRQLVTVYYQHKQTGFGVFYYNILSVFLVFLGGSPIQLLTDVNVA